MAVCIKSVPRGKDQHFIKTWIQQRFLNLKTKLNLPAKQPVEHLKSTKPLFTQWNRYFELMNGTGTHNSTANFHHLALNIYDVACITSMLTRNFAKDNKQIPGLALDDHFKDMNEVFANQNLEKELSRLRRSGAMKDIPIKIPEGIQGIKGTEKKH